MEQYFTLFEISTKSTAMLTIISTIITILLGIACVLFIFLRFKLNDINFVSTNFGIPPEELTMLNKKQKKIAPQQSNNNQSQQVATTVQTPNSTIQSNNKINTLPAVDNKKQVFRRLENGVYCFYQQDEQGNYYRVNYKENK